MGRQAIFPYYGGKFQQASKLLTLMPEPKPWHYVEPFAGALNVYFALPREWCKSATLIDLDGDLINLYRVLAFQRDEFLGELAWLPEGCDALFHDFNGLYADEEVWGAQDPVKRAVWYYWMLCNRYPGRRGMKRSLGSYSGKSRGVRSKASSLDSGRSKLSVQSLVAHSGRLGQAEIRSGDALELLPRYFDAADAFWFLDPPYRRRGPTPYAGSVSAGSADFFAQLLGILRNTKARWLMTVDLENELGDLFDSKWHVTPLGTIYSSTKGGPRKKSSEVAVMNYELPKEARIDASLFRWFERIVM